MLGAASYNTEVANRVSCEVLNLTQEDVATRQPRNCEAIGSWLLEKLYKDSEPTVKLRDASALGKREVSITGINRDQCFDISAQLFRHATSIELNGSIKFPSQENFHPQKAANGCGTRAGPTMDSLIVTF